MSNNGQSYKFLLIDDSRLTRRLMKKALDDLGIGECEFLEATNGRAALDELERTEYDVDAIFCDLYMPDMDGMEFLKSLAARNKLDGCPVIVVTGDLSPAGGEEAVRRGATAWIGKPFTPDTVRDALSRALAVS
jgi:two-component system chemotaxis response regulator CheY